MAILATVGGSERDIDVVQTGQDLATAFDEPLIVLNVLSEQDFDSRREARTEYYQDDGVRDASAVAKERAEEALDHDDLDNVTGVSADGTVGEPAVKILEKAAHHDARYLVIGGRKRSPVGKALFGSVTQSILLDADRPVVTVTGE